MSFTIPYAKGSDTSEAAAISIEPHVERCEQIVLNCIRYFDDKGVTCDAIEEVTELSHQCASARICGLKKKSLIHDSGLRRKTRSGRSAVVWLANTK